ncbi:hypothetical protein CTZ28_31485 [Streptomyces shenzhenensis]|uniref:Translation initiation factor 2 n=1 Tax=Streptomyces shenzhenensis TaxID=943815 RepID=A0A3M0HXY1_9ACTN|nr:hypothetical protein CTZ28_31485 [Streptomyces shenzhenensis]
MPVGHDASRWSTFRSERTLVVAARTVTSTVRILESLPAVLDGDGRVTVVFAHDPTSAFNAGVLDLLHQAGCRVMPWEQLAEISPDLILTASENIEVPEGDCPVLVLPHGVGFQKQVPDSRSTGERLSGVVPDALLEAGRAWLAVSHPAQEQQLLAAHPKTAGHTVLVGDPCLDELLVSRPRRTAYRTAMGLTAQHRLVLVSSTWGPTSLLGRHPELPARLLAELPWDEYRVAAVVHPNVWAAHGAWQLRTVLGNAVPGGLVLVPPVHAWRSALVAADVVIGDHGSVTLYGAAAGAPVLLGAFGRDSVAGTAVADLAARAPRLDPAGDLRGQIEDAVRSHSSLRYAAVAERAFAARGQALTRLRRVVYHLLRLPEPDAAAPSVRSVPVADPPGAEVTSWLVTTALAADDGEPVVGVCRFPAVLGTPAAATETPVRFAHLACADDERDSRLTESASVVLRRHPADRAVEAVRWIRRTLARWPGCLMTAAAVRGGGVLVGLRDGRMVEAVVTGPPVDAGLPAAVVYTCLRGGVDVDGAVVTMRVGDRGREEDVALRLRPVPAG